MTKISKHNEFLTNLKELIVKEAQQSASGVPGQDTNYTSVSAETEHTNKNDVGPEKLNDKQKYEQKPATDSSTPVKTVKKSEEADVETKEAAEAPTATKDLSNEKLAQLGQEVLALLQKASAQEASGVPGQDTHYTRVSDETEKTNKNDVGPEKLNDKQKYEQKPSTDSSEPIKGKTAADQAAMADKVASFEWGRQIASELLKQAAVNEYEMYKQAGRRDFETLIATAAAQLQEEQAQSQQKQAAFVNEKEAEEAGAKAFEDIYKQAQAELAKEAAAKKEAEELSKKASELDKLKSELEAKIASFDSIVKKHEAELAKKAEDEREAQKMAAMAQFVTDSVIARLKDDAANNR